MTGTVVAVVHGVAPAHRRVMVGSLLPAMERRGFRVDVVDVADVGTVDLAGVDVVCVMGSPASVYDTTLAWIAPEEQFLQAADAANIPILGVCFGGQILARALGGSVTPSRQPEYGFTTVRSARDDLIAPGPWMQFHHDTIIPPEGAEVLATTDDNVQAFAVRRHLGLQFHPEITPECFVVWRTRTGDSSDDITSEGVDLAPMAEEIDRRADAAAADCDELFGRFLTHAGLSAA